MSKRTIIIAEAGVNHNGDMNMAKKLIDAAVAAGVDYVKFKSFFNLTLLLLCSDFTKLFFKFQIISTRGSFLGHGRCTHRYVVVSLFCLLEFIFNLFLLGQFIIIFFFLCVAGWFTP